MNNIVRKGLRYAFYRFNNLLKTMEDEKYLKIAYYLNTGEKLNLEIPVTYTEKIQWLKLYYKNPILSELVDKYLVKNYVASKIGPEYIVPTLGVWENFGEINFDNLPEQFVLKCTHDSGGIVICKNKSRFDQEEAERVINKCLKRDYYFAGREWPYKLVKKRIIAEEYLEDELTQELRDYKFFCFNGKAEFMFVASDRQNPDEDTKFDFYDLDFNHLDIKNGHPNTKSQIQKPERFDDMIKLAEVLSEGFPHVRCDFYEANGNIYFGEMTFYHHSGFVLFEPDRWNKIFGDLIKLPKPIFN